jgi:hypothetical protein
MTQPIFLNPRGELYHTDYLNLIYYASHYSKHKDKEIKNINDLLTIQELNEWIQEFNTKCKFLMFFN